MLIGDYCLLGKRKRNCVENPNCLFGLGEEDEGVWSGKPDLGDDPENEAREPGTFAGIQVNFRSRGLLLRPSPLKTNA